MRRVNERLEADKNGAARPFLRWAGGKSKLVREIAACIPSDLQFETYREPFLGAGAMFFHLRPRCAVLSDRNPQLIACYGAIRDHPDTVQKYLAEHRRRHSVAHYYEVRDRYNRVRHSLRQAADFVYLNRTCFNGIFRVNTRGKFNVPWGGKLNPVIPHRAEIESLSGVLRRAQIMCCDYTDAVKNARKRDLIYLDPPYPPLNGTSYFRHYTPERFSVEDQAQVAQVFAELDCRGCYLLLSNAATSAIKDLYSRWRIREIPVRRWISCKGHRFLVNELIVTNF